MSDLTFNDPCIVFALRREAQSFLKEFRPQQRFRVAPCRACFCGPAWLTVLVLETGVGEEAARQAGEWLLSGPMLGNVPYRPRVVISAGFSGALSEDCRWGDLILATEVLDPQGNRWPAPWPGELKGDWRPPLLRRPVVTQAQLLATPEEKRRLGEQTGAAAVDMESAVLAQLCQSRAVPFASLRVILDDVHTLLSPQLIQLLAGGSVAPLRLLGALLRSPGMIGELWRLRRQARHAAEQLGLALGELLTLTLPWAADE